MPNILFDYRNTHPVGGSRMAFDASPRFKLAYDEIDPELAGRMRGQPPHTALMLFLEHHCNLSSDDLQKTEELLQAVIGENDQAHQDQAEEEEKARELQALKAKAAKAEDAIRRIRSGRDRRTAADGAIAHSAIDMFPSLARISQAS